MRAAARGLREGLGLDPAWEETWEPGPLAVPAPAARVGAWTDGPLGVSLQVPEGAALQEVSRPDVRLQFALDGARVRVVVDRLPDAATAAAQAAQLEVRAWETRESYKRQGLEPLRGAGGREGIRLECVARASFVARGGRTARRAPARVVQRTWLVPERRWAVSLEVVWARDEAPPGGLADLEASFVVRGDP